MQKQHRHTQTEQQDWLIVEGVSKHFVLNKHTIKAVDEVDLVLASRKFITITGPSGSGKSTLLFLLGGLEQPTTGKIIIDGITVNAIHGREETRFRRNTVGFIFQFFYLIPNLSAFENVLLSMELKGHVTSRERQRAHELLTLVGIDEIHQTHHPAKLSGGQQQRVAIARAMANDPLLLLADEPTGNLDTETGSQVTTLLKQLVEWGSTVIVATHDERIVAQADVNIRLEKGRIVTQSNRTC